MNRINGKTPEEIKRGLECCYDEDRALCEKCPYHYVRKDGQMRFVECSSMHSLGVDTMTYIEQLEAQVPQWISIKERLPEKHLRVIICNGHGIVNCGWRSYHKDRSGMELWTVGDEPHHANDIKYWMPLPEPPGEGTQIAINPNDGLPW